MQSIWKGAISFGLVSIPVRRWTTEVASYRAFVDPTGEVSAEELRAALDAVGEVVGKVDSEEVLGKIFGTFCIGK